MSLHVEEEERKNGRGRSSEGEGKIGREEETGRGKIRKTRHD